MRVCLPEPPQVSCLPALRVCTCCVRTCISHSCGGGYPGTWVHSFIHSFIRPRTPPSTTGPAGIPVRAVYHGTTAQVVEERSGAAVLLWYRLHIRCLGLGALPWHRASHHTAAVDVRLALPSYRSGCRGRGRSRRIRFSSLSLSPSVSSFSFLGGVSPSRPVCPAGDTPSDLEPLTRRGSDWPNGHAINRSPINNVYHSARYIDAGLISSDLGLLAQATCSYSGSPGPRKSFGCTCSMISN